MRHSGENGAESGEADQRQPRPFSSGGVAEESSQSTHRARTLASRGSLRSLRDLQVPESTRPANDPLFTELPEDEHSEPARTGEWVPNLDHELDQAHRFTLLGRIYRPIRNFFRKTLGESLFGDRSTDSSKEGS